MTNSNYPAGVSESTAPWNEVGPGFGKTCAECLWLRKVDGAPKRCWVCVARLDIHDEIDWTEPAMSAELCEWFEEGED